MDVVILNPGQRTRRQLSWNPILQTPTPHQWEDIEPRQIYLALTGLVFSSSRTRDRDKATIATSSSP
ncbi:hypothetical protein TNCV_3582561 [Trichonephila clavipes]|nr:hypothetical protein TNCV_3582561 [Trichonephila clavipes]